MKTLSKAKNSKAPAVRTLSPKRSIGAVKQSPKIPSMAPPKLELPTKSQPSLQGTLAALKATQTRQKKALGESKNEAEKKSLAALIAARDARIAGVLQAIQGKLSEVPKSA